MRIRNLLALSAGVSLAVGSLVLSACSGDDDDVIGGIDAGGDATKAPGPDGSTGTKDSSPPADTGVIDTGIRADPGPADTGTDTGTDGGSVPANVLYTMSNDPTTGNNSVFAYKRAADGSLTPIAGSPFKTGGTGLGNPQQALGPDDSDYQLVASPDHTRLFAVNGGSDNISVFNIAADGTLSAVAGSPFASGGLSPVSVGFAGTNVIVANQDHDPARVAQDGTQANYATLTLSAAGALAPATGVTAQPAGLSPQMVLPTPDGTEVFGVDFMSAMGLRSFTVGANGALTKAPGDPYAIATDDAGADQHLLGLALSPTNKVLYAGFVLRSEIGVFTYDATGTLTAHGSGAVTGAAPCWIRVSKDGKHLYVTDTALDQISVMSASADGLTIQQIQLVSLANPGPTLDASNGGNSGHTSSEAYDEELSPDGKFLYVESERLTNDPTNPEGNMLHVLAVDPTTGMLTETTSAAVALDPDAGVPITARSEGLVVF